MPIMNKSQYGNQKIRSRHSRQNKKIEQLQQQLNLLSVENNELHYEIKLLQDKEYVLKSNLFDEKFYRRKYLKGLPLSEDALEHYLTIGAEQGYNPSKHFDTNYYRQLYSDVALIGMNPLVHYVKYGALEARLKEPLNIGRVFGIYTQDIFRRPGVYLGKIPRFWMSLRVNGPKGVYKLLKEKLSRGESSGVEYKQWITNFDDLSPEDITAIKKHCKLMKYKPKISILMPTYNTSEEYLRKAIESVQAQIYENWELCIADDASTKVHVKEVLDEYSDSDSRIKITYRTKNEHISASSNSALEIATGEYVSLFDHDDELSIHALYLVANTLNEHPESLMLYSDEDKIDDIDGRHDPYFKPDWNPDLLLSQNYVSHLGVYQRERVLELGGFRQGYEGSQDYDLVLRFTKGLKPNQIHHIPFILYHWRKHEESTAYNEFQKNYAHDAGLRAVQDYLDDVSEGKAKAELITNWGTMIRVKYDLPKEQPLVSIIIPTKNNHSILRRCLDSIAKKTSYQNYEILVIDNQSDDPACLSYLASVDGKDKTQVIKYNKPFNYSAVNNFAVKKTKGEIVCLLNDDTEVITQDWLSEMVTQAIRPEIGVVGVKLLYPDETVQHAGVLTGLGGVAGHAHKHEEANEKGYFFRAGLVQNFSVVTAACIALRKETYMAVGGLDESNLKIAFNDVDFCLRVRELGFRNLWTPFVQLYHHESKSRGYEDTPEKVERFQSEIRYMQARWGNSLLNDPAYNPNLSLASEQWHISNEPRIEKPWKIYL